MDAGYTLVRAVAFTVDVDRDVNQACQGQLCSISQGGGARFSSSADGLKAVLRVLERAGTKATFFWEGRTAQELSKNMDLPSMMKGHEVAMHGHEHEDFSGEGTGIPMDRGMVKQALDQGDAALDAVFGKAPRGFRAPYQRVSVPLLEELVARGCLYDSSETAQLMDGRVVPYRNSYGLLEAPVCWSRDRKGRKIVSYLWPYHEGKRPMSDYMDLVEQFDEGLLVIATHSWHMVESFCGGLHPQERIERGMKELGDLLDAVKGSGAELVTIKEYLEREHGL